MNAFYICGGLLALWAVVVSALGVMREDFPRSRGAARLVAAISIALAAAAIGTAVYTSATEEEEAEGEGASAPAPLALR